MRLLSDIAANDDHLIDGPDFKSELKTQRGRKLFEAQNSDVDEVMSFEFKRGCEGFQLDDRSEMTSASSLFEASVDPDFKYNSDAPIFIPSLADPLQTHLFPSDTDSHELSFRRKEKTEICKNWLQGVCRYGPQCAFAHGQEEVQKKTHVAAKYKASLCNSYHNAPFFCQYGSRCQFAHLTRDFGEPERPVAYSYA